MLAFCAPIPSRAVAAELSITGVNRAEFWSFLDSVYSTHMEDKLDLSLRYGELRGQLGFFLYEPSKPWNPDREPLRFLDYTVAYSPKRFEILYGKFFQSFGKGLVLRTYSDDDFRHYKSLHGLRATAKLPLGTELAMFGARLRDVFFQENTYKVMNSGDSLAPDSLHQVLGAGLESRPLRWFGFGGRYLRVNRDSLDDPSPKAFSELLGGDLLTSFGPFELCGEAAWRLSTRPLIGGREKGFGYYLSATGSVASYSATVQYMDYDGIGFPAKVSGRKEYRYNDPPTPIKSGVALNRGVDEKGVGLVLTATPLQSLYAEADFGRMYRHDDTSAGVLEGEGKVRYSLGTDWTFEAAFNHLYQKKVDGIAYERTVEKPVVHVNYLLGQHSLALEAEYGLVDETTLSGEEQSYGEAAAALSYGYGDLGFTVGYQRVSTQLEKRYDSETSWPVFEAVWSISERKMLRVRVGAERGGYTCSGGVCRFEAPFRGIKAQLISRF